MNVVVGSELTSTIFDQGQSEDVSMSPSLGISRRRLYSPDGKEYTALRANLHLTNETAKLHD